MKRTILLLCLVLAVGSLFLAYQNAGLCEPQWQTQATIESANTPVARCEAEGEAVIWDDASGSFSRPALEVIDEENGARHVRVYSCDDMHKLRFEVKLEQLAPGCSVAEASTKPKDFPL
jgi:hypothetical protein